MAPTVLRKVPGGLDDRCEEIYVYDDYNDMLYVKALLKRVYVGECYIHGIMNGEAIKQGVDMQEFVLV